MSTLTVFQASDVVIPEIATLLAQFTRLTEEMREAVLQDDYGRAGALLGERGVIAAQLQHHGQHAGKSEGHQHCKELIIESQSASRRLAGAINGKMSELIERLVVIHNMKPSQMYTKQGAGHGYRQGNE
jgi:hypothetical protein